MCPVEPQQKKARTCPAVGREPLLFTPGPLTTSAAVKQSMLVDYGSRDKLFLSAVTEVRDGLLAAAGASRASGYECVIVQGSGTMGVESVISSVVPKDGKLLILVNGAYGHRIAKMCSYFGIQHEVLEWPDSAAIDVDASMAKLRQDAQAGKPNITHVAVIHHETTAGVLNPLERLTKELKSAFPQLCLIVDSMSAFGAYDLQMDWGIDFAVSSANKCIEGVPGFSFALCRRSLLENSKGVARSLSLDLYDQWRNMESTGQFRFTPPTHAILAFRQALAEWNAEGGAQGRFARYRANYEVLEKEMTAMGFKFYVNGPHRSHLISTFLMPEDPRFRFQHFYDTLAARGYVIYPGKLAAGASFRFGTIGRLFPKDFEQLIAAVRAACAEMDVALPLKCLCDGSKLLSLTELGVKLCVFDMAGTTVDEGGLVYTTLKKAMAQQGWAVGEEAFNAWHGANKKEVVAHFAKLNGDEASVDKVYESFQAQLESVYFNDDSPVKAMPGVKDYFAKLRANGIKVGLDTGFPRSIADHIIKQLGFEDCIDGSVVSMEVGHGRPYPHMIYQLMRESNIEKISQVAKFGDTVRDVEEGLNAGTTYSYGVLSGADDAEALGKAGAYCVVNSVVDVPV